MPKPTMMIEAAERLAAADPEALRFVIDRLRQRLPATDGTAHVSEWPAYCGWVIGQTDIMALALPLTVPIESLAPDPVNVADLAPTMLEEDELERIRRLGAAPAYDWDPAA